MTWKMTALFLLLLCSFAAAQEPDFNQMTPDELQEYITLLQNNQVQPQQAPLLVTVQIDEELRQSIDMLQTEVGQLKLTNERMQERFAQFVTDNKKNLDDAKTDIYNQTEIKINTSNEAQSKELKEWIRLQTNPVRMNLPVIGIFTMLTAIFLLWTSKLYKGAS